MRGPTTGERRAGQRQQLARAGLIADDACLSTFSYPVLDEPDEKRLRLLVDWLSPTAQTTTGAMMERSKSLHDTEEIILHEVTELAKRAPEDEPIGSPAAILDPMMRMIEGNASEEDVLLVRAFSEIVSRVTLMLSQQLDDDKDSLEWTPTPLAFLQRL